MKKELLIQAVCFMLILLFTYTGLSKLNEHVAFEAQLDDLAVVHTLSPVLSYMLPLLELVIAVVLAVPHTRLAGLYASFVLLILFTLYLAGMLLSGTKLPCSCGGVIKYFSWNQHVVFNTFFVAISALGIRFQRSINKQSATTINSLLQ